MADRHSNTNVIYDQAAAERGISLRCDDQTPKINSFGNNIKVNCELIEGDMILFLTANSPQDDSYHQQCASMH